MRHCICINGTKDMKQSIEDIISKIAHSSFPTQTTGDEADCVVCLCKLEDPYRLKACTHTFYRPCLLEQCESAIKIWEGFPMYCSRSGCGEHFLLSNLKSLFSTGKLEELFRASLGDFVIANAGTYRLCPLLDCPSVYRIAVSDMEFGAPFVYNACYGSMRDRMHAIN
ncbi:hypothetical protein CQW23_01520 [Capsicum baccatum]|uniref:RING-type domain-containing protein n=1 Tax=Capsicum baccatum TaxID=33114 RepID=A0A2G2XNU4_CAPBA|nr:hypothetical protein CQW23_01520 [Capsicum baccatum]